MQVDKVCRQESCHPNRQRPWPLFLISKIRIEYIEKFIRENLADCDRQDKHCYCQRQYIESRIRPYHLGNYILPGPILKVKVKVKVRHILTLNIWQTVTDRKRLILATNRKSHMGFRLAYLHLTLVHSNGQGQSYPNPNYEYFYNGNR